MATLNSTMKKLTLKKFLFCVDLKTGGTILAWWSMITSPIWAFLNAILAYGDLVEIIQERADMIVMRTLIAVLLLVVSLLFVFNTHYSYELLKGIKQVSGRRSVIEIYFKVFVHAGRRSFDDSLHSHRQHFRRSELRGIIHLNFHSRLGDGYVRLHRDRNLQHLHLSRHLVALC